MQGRRRRRLFPGHLAELLRLSNGILFYCQPASPRISMQRMHTRAIGLAGASGYSGIEATRILSAHPRVELRFVTSDRWQGSTVAERLGVSGAAGALQYENLDRSRDLAKGCDAVILATPAEFSVAAVPFLLERGIKAIDISGAFRLKEAAEYPLF